MPAFVDMRCDRCGKKYGYFGEVKDAKCPHCGAVPVGLQDLEKQLQAARDRAEKEWDKKKE